MEECSLYLFLLIRDRPFVFVVGEGLFFQQYKLELFGEVKAFFCNHKVFYNCY